MTFDGSPLPLGHTSVFTLIDLQFGMGPNYAQLSCYSDRQTASTATRQPPALQLLGWTFPAARENNLMDSILSIKKWKQNKNVIINHKKTQFKMISTHSWWSWASFGSDSIHFSLIQICVVVVVFRRLLINYIIFILNWMLCTKDQDCDIFRFKYIFSIHSWIPSWVAAGVCWLDSKRWGAETWRELNWSAVGE